jgi:hypothetical protein
MIQFFSIRHDLILTQGQLLVEAGDRQRGARIAEPFAAFALLLNRSMAISRGLSRKSPREALVNEHRTAIASRLEHARWQIGPPVKKQVRVFQRLAFASPQNSRCPGLRNVGVNQRHVRPDGGTISRHPASLSDRAKAVESVGGQRCLMPARTSG